jgi:arylsulfatase
MTPLWPRFSLKSTLFWLAGVLSADTRPNLVIILADDMGYGDLGCYGSEIHTPNLDRLAANGVRFSEFYNTARCWPSRAALLTGYYAQAVRRDAVPGLADSGVKGVRPEWAKLLPARLQSVGYRTYHSGKWHVDGLPMQNGFNHSYSLNDHDRYFNPKQHTRDDVKLPAVEPAAGYYSTVAIADHAISCLQEHAEKHTSEPFFSFVAFTSPHFPLQALPEDIARYQDTYQAGWDVLREARFERQKKIGLGVRTLSATERDLGPPYVFPKLLDQLGPNEVNRPVLWANLTPAQQRFQAGKMAVHAAMVDRMDHEIGRILEQIQNMEAEENTLVVFLSDNGASAEMMIRGDGHHAEASAGSAETFLCLGPGWSTMCNAPLRRHKTWVHEGGIATSFIAYWPAGLLAQGAWCHTPAHLVDIVPTFLELANAPALTTLPNQPAAPGKSLVSLWRKPTEANVPPRTFWWLHEGNAALRVGDYKVVKAKGDAWALYDVKADRAEQHDLAAQDPQRLQAMTQQWERQAEEYFKLAKQK